MRTIAIGKTPPSWLTPLVLENWPPEKKACYKAGNAGEQVGRKPRRISVLYSPARNSALNKELCGVGCTEEKAKG